MPAVSCSAASASLAMCATLMPPARSTFAFICFRCLTGALLSATFCLTCELGCFFSRLESRGRSRAQRGMGVVDACRCGLEPQSNSPAKLFLMARQEGLEPPTCGFGDPALPIELLAFESRKQGAGSREKLAPCFGCCS